MFPMSFFFRFRRGLSFYFLFSLCGYIDLAWFGLAFRCRVGAMENRERLGCKLEGRNIVHKPLKVEQSNVWMQRHPKTWHYYALKI